LIEVLRAEEKKVGRERGFWELTEVKYICEKKG